MRTLRGILALTLGVSMSSLTPIKQAHGAADQKPGLAASDLAAVDHLLSTTRSVRKRLDLTKPVEPEVIEKALDIALQAPTGSNNQNWHFIVITDPDKKKAIADLYRKGADQYANSPAPDYGKDDPRTAQRKRVYASAGYLYDHLHEVPAIVIACIEGRVEKEAQVRQASTYGSILPAAWSFMLALRARGVGSAWTTLHLIHEKDAAKTLGIPDTVTQAVLMPVAYYKGTGFQTRETPPRARPHALERLGTAPLKRSLRHESDPYL
jgi:nitroreductase